MSRDVCLEKLSKCHNKRNKRPLQRSSLPKGDINTGEIKL